MSPIRPALPHLPRRSRLPLPHLSPLGAPSYTSGYETPGREVRQSVRYPYLSGNYGYFRGHFLGPAVDIPRPLERAEGGREGGGGERATVRARACERGIKRC